MANPEDKEMKMQWITIDGRQTPVILPQIWDHEKEDWIVTSTENPLPTQLTGSNVEQDVIIAGGKRDEITILPRKLRQAGTVNEIFDIPPGVSSILFVHVVYQVSGSFKEEEGHSFFVAPFEGSAGRVLFGTLNDYRKLMDFHTSTSSTANGSYSFMFNPYADEMLNPRKDVLMKMPVVFNDMRLTLYIEGQFGENEGIDSEIICRFNYN